MWGFKIAIACLSSVAATAAYADTLLWQNLKAGMSKDEVRVLYPASEVQLTASCKAKLLTRFKGGRLVSVHLKLFDKIFLKRSEWDAAKHCQEMMKSSIIERYGTPDKIAPSEAQRTTPDIPNFADKIDPGVDVLWNRPGLNIKFHFRTRTPFTVVSYEYVAPLQSAPPDAASKL